MKKSEFLYVTFIKTTPEKLWRALTEPEFTRQFFFGTTQECAWQVGAPWRIVAPDGMIMDSGEVLEIKPPQKLVLKWRNEFKPELRAEGFSRMTYELEPQGELVKLTVCHEIDAPESKLIAAVAGGWPMILASLKSLLETGQPLAWSEDD